MRHITSLQQLAALARLAPSPRSATLALQIPRALTSEVLGALAPLLVAAHDRVLYCADAANRFDPYVFATQARQAALPPDVLDRVFVSRAFTIHQLQAVVADLLPAALEQRPLPMVALLGLDELFREETLPVAERRTVLGRIAAGLRQLPAGAKLLVTYEASHTQAPWWRPMLELGDVQARIERSTAGPGFQIDMLRCAHGQDASDV